MHEKLKQVLKRIKQEKAWYPTMSIDLRELSDWVLRVLSLDEWDDEIIETVRMALIISNILYNNSDKGQVLLTDGVYDLLLEKYKSYRSNFPIGSEYINMNTTENKPVETKAEEDNGSIEAPFTVITEAADMLYYQDLIKNDHSSEFNLSQIPPFTYEYTRTANMRNVPHSNLELVGTLDKCKFALTMEAIEQGVDKDPSVKIFERDFIGEHIKRGIIDPNQPQCLIAELKYDGVGVVVKVKNGEVIYAYTRGDTENDKSVDLTDFLGGYQFPRAKHIGGEVEIKCEMIILNPYLNYFRQYFGMDYRNSRMAAIGIMGRTDALRYRDFVTLVPLKTDIIDDETGHHLNRLVEIEFLNEYYAREVNLKAALMHGNYVQLLYCVKKFVEEAQFMRQYFPFLYDGVVISYMDENIIERLGRESFVDKYSVAIKFTPLKVQTQFLGYTYTIGKNGVITPILNYNPVEFYGTVHSKSSGHSYSRFQDLALKLGDYIEVSYVNDVMPYATKPDLDINRNNPNPVIEFPTTCPFCGSPLFISPSGKSVSCVNMQCPGIIAARLTSMLELLGVRDFSEEAILKIMENCNIISFADFMELDENKVSFLGPTMSVKLIQEINKLKTESIYDYEIMGSIGFSNIGKKKWQLILNKIPLNHIISLSDEELAEELHQIKGIGQGIIDTIIENREYFLRDIEYICNMSNIVPYLYKETSYKIKFSGIRDKDLTQYLRSLGLEADDGAVTKDTSILIVPSEDYSSAKTQQAVKYNIPILVYKDFVEHMDDYIGALTK